MQCLLYKPGTKKKKKKNILPSTKDLKSLVQPAISAIPFPCRFFRQNRTKIKLLAATIMGSSTQKLYLCSLSSDAEFYRSVRTSGFIALTTSWKSRVRFFFKQILRQDTLSSRLWVFWDKWILEMVASGMSNHLVETRPTSQGSGGGFLMFQEPKQNHRWMPCFVTCFSKSRPFRTSWIMPKIMENHVESHWKTTEIKSNNYFPPPKKKSSIIPQFVPFLMLGFQTRHQKHSIWNPPWWLAHNALQDHQGFLRKGLG